jgi:hypothetical protein
VGFTILLSLLYLFPDVAKVQSSDVFLHYGVITPKQFLFLVKDLHWSVTWLYGYLVAMCDLLFSRPLAPV